MLSKQERDIQTIQSQLAALQAELGTELLSQLNQNEQQEVRYEILLDSVKTIIMSSLCRWNSCQKKFSLCSSS